MLANMAFKTYKLVYKNILSPLNKPVFFGKNTLKIDSPLDFMDV